MISSFRFLLDVPHLLKRARTACLDKGFFLPPSLDGRRETLKKADFEKILEANKPHDFKMNFRLTSNHLNLVGSQAQRVRLATQVFSRTNAKSFLFLSGIFQGSQAKAKHDACLVFNDW